MEITTETTTDGAVIFVAQCDYEERAVPKSAGWRWNPTEKAWWTSDRQKAATLIEYADEAARSILSAEAESREKALELSRAADADVEIPCPDGLSYLPYQRAGIAYALNRPNVLIADDMGLGKTIQAIGVINADPSIERILIVCPASLRLNWYRELKKWLVRDRQIGIANGQSCPDGHDILIINYDILAKHQAKLTRQRWDLMAVDECHYLKNGKAIRTAALLGGKAKIKGEQVVFAPVEARRKAFMTGTPIPNRPVEGWTIFHAVAPQEFDKFFSYARAFCDAHRTRYGWDFKGASNLGILQEKLRGSCMVRRLKADVLSELPAKRRQLIEAECPSSTLEAEQKAARQYEERKAEIEARIAALKESGGDHSYAEAVEALRECENMWFTEMSKLRHETALKKVPQVVEHLKDITEGGRKVVCFAHHRDVIAKIVGEFASDSVVSITGDTPMEERQANVDRFQTDPNVVLFVGNIQAAGVGITLTASSHVVFAELDWVPGAMSQAEDRCILEGQLIRTRKRGLIPIEEAQIGDEVLTHLSNWKRVTDTHSRLTRSKEIITEVKYCRFHQPIKCTSDHRILVRRGDAEPLWVEAGDIKPRDLLCYPKPIESERFDRVRFDKSLRVDETFKKGPGIQRKGQLKRMPEWIELSHEVLFMIGWYLAEGCASRLDIKSPHVSMSGCRAERPILESIATTLERFGIKSSIREKENQDAIELRASGTELSRWFASLFGRTCKEKNLPEFLERPEASQAKSILDAYIAGDGEETDQYRKWVSSSAQLAVQIADLAAICGYSPGLHIEINENGTTMWRGRAANGGSPRGGTCQNYIYYPVSSVKSYLRQKIRVYDLTVEDDHSFVAGFASVHNCHRIGQRDSVLVQHFVLDGSIDAKLALTLIEKQRVLDEALDRDYVATEADHSALDEAKRQAAEAMSRASETQEKRAQREREAEAMSPAQIAAIHEGLRHIEGLCDGARVLDGRGFSKLDAAFGRSLAYSPSLTPRQAAAGLRLVVKYKRQLSEELVEMAKGNGE